MKDRKEKKEKKEINQFLDLFYKNIKYFFILFFFLLILIFYFIIKQQTSKNFLNLINCSNLQLKEVFSPSFSSSSSSSSSSSIIYIHYCSEKGNINELPIKLTEAYQFIQQTQQQQQTQFKITYQITVLNCSQILPSGKTIQNKFKLNKKWKPIIFTTSPWSKPTQIPPLSLKESNSISNFIFTSTKPIHKYLLNNKEFQDSCQYKVKNSTKGVKSNEDNEKVKIEDYNGNCLVIMKGNRYTESHSSLIDSIIQEYYRYNVVIINSNDRRLSFEKYLKDNSYLNPNNYAIKVYLIKNVTYYMELTQSPTHENIQQFMKKIKQVRNIIY